MYDTPLHFPTTGVEVALAEAVVEVLVVVVVVVAPVVLVDALEVDVEDVGGTDETGGTLMLEEIHAPRVDWNPSLDRD